MVIRSFAVVLMETTSLPLTVNSLPSRAGFLGLMVASSKAKLAFAVMRTGGGGGSGIAHAVSGVARTRFSGSGAPWVQVPVISFPLAPSFPS